MGNLLVEIVMQSVIIEIFIFC